MLSVIATLTALALIWFAAKQTIGFAAQRSADYAGQEPQLDIRRHLSGPILCEGVIYGPTGRVTSRFVADMQGHWTGNRGVLDEQFHYSSGQVQSRRWHLSMGNDGTVIADADDIVEPGHGQQEGSGLRLTYRIRLPEHAGGWVLDVTDWMYLLDNGTIVNRSQFRKFGIKVAELVATLRPAAA